MASKARPRQPPDLLRRRRGDRRRDDHGGPGGQVLRLEVVEHRTLVDDHLARHARLGRPAVEALEHRALDLHPGHRGFRDHLEVVDPRGLDGLLQAGRAGDPRDPDARPAAGRLDEDRPPQLGDLIQDALALGQAAGPVAVADHHVPADREAARGHDQLHVLLVHAGGAGEHARARVGGAGHLQQSLQRAVLAVGPVQQRQHDVDLAEVARHLAGGVDLQRAAAPAAPSRSAA